LPPADPGLVLTQLFVPSSRRVRAPRSAPVG